MVLDGLETRDKIVVKLQQQIKKNKETIKIRYYSNRKE